MESKRYKRIDVAAMYGDNGVYEGIEVIRGELDYGMVQKSGAIIAFSDEQAIKLRDALTELLSTFTPKR